MAIQVRILTERDYEAWDALVSSAPNGSIYSTAEYLDVLCTFAGGNFRIAAVIRDNALLGGIALYESNERWGVIVRPRTLLAYNGLVYSMGKSQYPSRRESFEREMQGILAGFLEEQGYSSVQVKSRSPITDVRVFMARGWKATPTYTYLVKLEDLATQWQLVDRNLRRLIRRCDSGEFTFTDDDDFDSFYGLHRQIHMRKGAPIYLPEKDFKSYFSVLHKNGRARLLHMRIGGGKSVAAQLVLAGEHDIAHTVAAGSHQQYANTGVSAALRWKSFEYLARRGFTGNDLTDASLNSISRFKSQFGGELQMNLVLTHTESLKYRVGTGLASTLQKLANPSGAFRRYRQRFLP